MACKVEPKVTNEKGEKITAPLYTEIKKMVGPIYALKVFNKVMSQDVKDDGIFDKMEMDKYGMPTIDSLLQHTNLSEYIDNLHYGNEIAKELFGKSSVSFNDAKTTLNYFNKVIEFNNNNKNFAAFLVKNADSKEYEITVVKRSKYSEEYKTNFEVFADNCNKVFNVMSNAGLDNHYIANHINYNYNVKFVKSLASNKFNPNAIITNTINLSKVENLSPISVGYLLDSETFKTSALVERTERVLNNSLNFVYDYLVENGIINPNEVSKEDVMNKQKYVMLVRNHIIASVLSNSFSLKDKEFNNKYRDLLVRTANSIRTKLEKIEAEDLKPNNTNPSDFTEPKKDILISFDTLYKQADNTDVTIDGYKTLEKLILAEKSRLGIAIRTGKSQEAGRIKKRIETLTTMYDSGIFTVAFSDFLKEEIKEIKSVYVNMQKTMDEGSTQEKAYAVRDCIQLCNYYNNCIEYFNAYMSKSSTYKDDLKNEIDAILKTAKIEANLDTPNEVLDVLEKLENFVKKLTPAQKSLKAFTSMAIDILHNYYDILKNPILENKNLSAFTQTVNTAREDAQKFALTLTAEFLDKFNTEESKIVPWGKEKGTKIDITKELTVMNQDINMYDYYLDAMADSPDNIMRLTDKAIKVTKSNIRIEVMEFARELKKEATILKRAGVKDFSWMYERKNGVKTGNYVMPNTPEFANIVKDKAKARFYQFFMEKKMTIDKCYPNNDGNYQIIGIRKDRLERLKNAKGVKDAASQVWEGVKDNWIDREDDDDIAGYTELFTDAAGNEIKLLPIHYNHVTENNAEHMSEDAVSTLIAYANKGIEYHSMQSLMVSIELEREVLKQRSIPVESQGKKVLNLVNKFLYKENPELIKQNEVRQKDLGRSNAYKFFDKHIDMKLYGKKREKGKNIGKISSSKLVDQLNKKTAIAALSLNLLNGFSNILTGTHMTRIESVCQQYFSVKDLAWADATYSKEMPAYLAEKGNNIKESKLHLFIEQFDVMQDFDKYINDEQWMKDTWFKKMMNSEFMSVIQNAGEHYLNCRVALAMAHSIKLKTKYGKETNLWEMLDIEYLQEDGTYGSEDRKLGARLKLKEECVDMEGHDFTLSNENIHKVSRKMAGVNQGIHGIYNEQDANLIQTIAIGRLLYNFRKWIPKSLDKRFANLKYNYDVEDWTEGYYQTLAKFLIGLIKEHNGMRLEVITRWKQLDERQRKNCIRAFTEILQFYGLLITNNTIWHDDDDKSEYSWLKNMVYYQMIRLQSELAALMPLSVLGSKDNTVTEFIRLFKNPISAISPVSDAQKLTLLLYPSTWTDTVQRGPYKGHTKAFVTFWGNKFLFPIGAMIPKNVGPENYVGYYLNN